MLAAFLKHPEGPSATSAVAAAADDEKLEPVSLTNSSHSDQSEPVAPATSDQLNGGDSPAHTTASASSSADSDYGDSDDCGAPADATTKPIKCSAVHTLERDMPTCDYSHLVHQLRQQILDYARENPGLYSMPDLQKCQHDDWFLARFLLRHKLHFESALDMLKQYMRFNNESLANHLKPADFPAEIYQVGGLFPYGFDRKGNRMLYLRVRVHKRTPEITGIVQAFIYYNIKRLDEAAGGRGISIVIDCSGGGLANADMDMLLFLISTLKNYFPKGLSYFLVHQLPWILKPFWHIAKAWVPEEHRQLIKFSDATSVFEYIDHDNLPDFMGGSVEAHVYNQVPENCTILEEAAKLWGVEARTIGRVLDKFREHLPEKTVSRIEAYLAAAKENEHEQQAHAESA